MTEQIQKSITLLRTKFMGLHQNLVSAKEQIAALNLENEKLKSALNNVEESRTLLEADLEKAKLEVVAANKQVVNTTAIRIIFCIFVYILYKYSKQKVLVFVK